MKGNQYRKLFRCDYWGWRWYCRNSALRQKRADKQRAKELTRIARKRIPWIFADIETIIDSYSEAERDGGGNG